MKHEYNCLLTGQYLMYNIFNNNMIYGILKMLTHTKWKGLLQYVM